MHLENNLTQIIFTRSSQQCELCHATKNLTVFAVEPSNGTAEQAVLVCQTCKNQIENPSTMDPNHWRCLN